MITILDHFARKKIKREDHKNWSLCILDPIILFANLLAWPDLSSLDLLAHIPRRRHETKFTLQSNLWLHTLWACQHVQVAAGRFK